MIVLTAGLPGRFAEWCESLLVALVSAAGQRPDIFNADSLSDLGTALLARNLTDGVMVTRQPDAALAKVLKTQPRPFVVAVEKPQACVSALMQDHGLLFLDAVRSAASACAALLALMDIPGALVLRAEDGQDPQTIAGLIASHYHLDLPPATIARVAAEPILTAMFAERGNLPPLAAQAPQAKPDLLATGHLLPALLDGALASLRARLEKRELSDIAWHRDLFLSADHSGQPPAAVIDVTGPSRCLLYGPYIRLPAGSWSCALMLGFGQDAIGLTLVAEIVAGTVLSRAEFEIREAGIFEIEFSCVLANADQPVEVRLSNRQAAFEGHIALIQALMRPLKAVRVPATIV